MDTEILLFIKVRDVGACAGIQQKSTQINMTFIYGILILMLELRFSLMLRTVLLTWSAV